MGYCSPGDDIYADEEVGAVSKGKPTGMHPSIADSLRSIRLLEANVQGEFLWFMGDLWGRIFKYAARLHIVLSLSRFSEHPGGRTTIHSKIVWHNVTSLNNHQLTRFFSSRTTGRPVVQKIQLMNDRWASHYAVDPRSPSSTVHSLK